jgi:alkylation response protein AidB-like acyl-CoA dehydrogenase
MRRTLFEDVHEEFRAAFRSFLEREAVPNRDRWEAEGIVDRELFFNVVIAEELQQADVNAPGLGLSRPAELFFDEVRVPIANRLGEEGAGFLHLVTNLPQERMSIAVTGVAAARAAFERTLAYAKERRAFGQPIGTFQHSRFALAEMATEIEVAQSFVDRCVLALNAGELTADEAAMAKWWCTELQGRVVDRGVQLHGGYGYMTEYPIGRAYADARITRIYGGTTEIMKEIIGRSLGV